MSESSGVAAGDSNVPPPNVREWISQNGFLRVHGVDYVMPTMDVHALQELHQLLATDADGIRSQLAKIETEQSIAGTLDYDKQEWRNRARHALTLKKKQMMAIHTEFARRKRLVPPLADFAFPAVFQMFGPDVLATIQTLARELQAKRMEVYRRRGEAVSTEVGSRKYICGDKVGYADEEAALQVIRMMAVEGLEANDLKMYLCPWCNLIHIGNDPKRKKRRKRAARKRSGDALL